MISRAKKVSDLQPRDVIFGRGTVPPPPQTLYQGSALDLLGVFASSKPPAKISLLLRSISTTRASPFILRTHQLTSNFSIVSVRDNKLPCSQNWYSSASYSSWRQAVIVTSLDFQTGSIVIFLIKHMILNSDLCFKKVESINNINMHHCILIKHIIWEDLSFGLII